MRSLNSEACAANVSVIWDSPAPIGVGVIRIKTKDGKPVRRHVETSERGGRVTFPNVNPGEYVVQLSSIAFGYRDEFYIRHFLRIKNVNEDLVVRIHLDEKEVSLRVRSKKVSKVQDGFLAQIESSETGFRKFYSVKKVDGVLLISARMPAGKFVIKLFRPYSEEDAEELTVNVTDADLARGIFTVREV